VLGPQVLDMVPYASDGTCPSVVRGDDASSSSSSASYSEPCEGDYVGRMLAGSEAGCSDFMWERWDVGHYIGNPWTFLGNVGVTLMIMESGMHIHFDKVKAVGKKSLLVAILGTGLPIVFGVVVVGWLWNAEASDRSWYPWGFSAGCAFAPTSVGISIKLLDESKMLNSITGQTVLIAAFIDDVFSLVTLVILQTLARGDITAASIIVPLVASFSFLGLGVLLAIYVFPHIPKLLESIPLAKNVSIQRRDEVHLLLMFSSLWFFGWVSAVDVINGVPFIGSHLLGAFVAGMCWVNVPRSHGIWENQLKRLVRWMMRMFFSATVGFAVPVQKMISLTALWRGVVLGIGPCISTKLVSGLFARVEYKDEQAKMMAKSASWATKFVQPQQLLVGIAMVARGEFAYLVAAEAQTLNRLGTEMKMMSGDVYAAVVWALVLATICSPVMFRWALAVFDRATPVHRSTFIGGEDKQYARRAFVIRIAGRYTPGVQREIFNALHTSGVDVLDAVITSVRQNDAPDAEVETFIDNFTVLSRGAKKDFDDEKLEEMHHIFAEILNDQDAQIIFSPPAENPSQQDHVVEVQIIGEHHPSVLHEITDVLSDMGLDVIKAVVDKSVQPGDSHDHHEKSHNSPGSPRGSRRGLARSPSTSMSGAPAGAPLEAPAAAPALLEELDGTPEMSTSMVAGNEVSLKEVSVDGRHTALGKKAAAFSTSFSHTFTRQGTKKALSKIFMTTTKDGVSTSSHTHDVGCEIFYARESEVDKVTTAERRHDIQSSLRQVLAEHQLRGEVMVRVLHPTEIALVHTVPKLEQSLKARVNVVKCVGKHHKELLHEICDHFDAENLEVIHADIDQEEGEDVHTFYIKKTDEGVIASNERSALKDVILGLYKSHSVAGVVSITTGDHPSPAFGNAPMSPGRPIPESLSMPSTVMEEAVSSADTEKV